MANSTQYKRDIRHDIAEQVKMDKDSDVEYEVPEKGDRRFNRKQLQVLIHYFDKPSVRRRGSSGMAVQGSLRHHLKVLVDCVNEVIDEDIDSPKAYRDWSGFTKEELLLIQKAVMEYEQIGFPDVEDVAKKIMEETGLDEEAAKEKAKKFIDDHTKEIPEHSVGFTVDEIYTTQTVQVDMNKHRLLF